MKEFDVSLKTRIVSGSGCIDRLGRLWLALLNNPASPKKSTILLVTDSGVSAAGHLERARTALMASGFKVAVYDGVRENPGEADIEACWMFAARQRPAGLVGLGGGSAMDTAKALNFLLAAGGRMSDYQGYDRTSRPMLPLVLVPTTTGTGSEVQSYALIARDGDHSKMACGARQAAAAVALLDPILAASQPQQVLARAGLDALAHALETAVSKSRSDFSALFSRRAAQLLFQVLPTALGGARDDGTMAALQVGACYAGQAIELSMLGAAHACANPLSARLDLAHGCAVGMMLPHVIRFNARDVETLAIYAEVARSCGLATEPEGAGEILARAVEGLLDRAGMPRYLDRGAVEIGILVEDALTQWTGRHNPRPLEAEDFEELYRKVMA